jgi:hypothetical protein
MQEVPQVGGQSPTEILMRAIRFFRDLWEWVWEVEKPSLICIPPNLVCVRHEALACYTCFCRAS